VLDHVVWHGVETAADVGCGPGAYLPRLSQRAAAVVGLDLSLGMLQEVRTSVGIRGGTFAVAGDAGHLPFPDGSVAVLLAAFMLYHVPDIHMAIGEFRRVIGTDGTLLVALNGANDKAELGAVWQEAGTAALGPGFRVPHWSARANLDNAPEMIGRHFGSVTLDRLPGQFRFPQPGPPVAWLNSLRSGTEDLVADEEWAAVVGEALRRIEGVITRHGQFVVTKDSGVILAR
jgi:SAM-dependent methyltransferase